MKIGIVGAGIIGRLIALQLLKKGAAVTLFDKDTRTGINSCSMTAAGLLAPFAETETAKNLLATLGKYSIERWPSIIATLTQPAFFQKSGVITLAHRQDQTELEKFKRFLREKSHVLPPYQELDKNALTQLEPEIATHFSQGIYFPDEAHLSPPEILAALENSLLQLNIDWRSETTVTAINAGEIVWHDNQQQFDFVFDCRGLGAKTDINFLRGVRGELIWLHAPEISLLHPLRLLHPRYPVYIVPRPNNIYVIGASFIESDDMSPISVRTTLELLSAAYSIHRGFAEARIVNTLVNCRPALPDHLPQIFMSDKLIRINGLYSYGYSLAPALMDEVIAIFEHGINAAKFPELLRIN